MFSVIFEVLPMPAHLDTYLDLAMRLKPEVEAIDGFLSVERFASRGRPGWILSLQFWRDDAAITRWRTHELHHRLQERGRRELFQDYRLRVVELISALSIFEDRPAVAILNDILAESAAQAPVNGQDGTSAPVKSA